MVQFANGFTAWVEVGDRKASEYDIETKVGNSDATNCFIEAEEDKNFTVWYQNAPALLGCQTRADLYIDGKLIMSYVECRVQNSHIAPVSFKGYRTKITTTHQFLRKFTFGKMETTASTSGESLSKSQLDQACSIQLDFKVLPLIGKMNHGSSEERQFQAPSVTRVHEDSKAAILGLSAKAGDTIQQPASGSCRCLVETTSRYRHTITFRYLPSSHLIAKGYKEDVPRETENTRASRRQPRSLGRCVNGQSSIPVEQVKRESTIKSENSSQGSERSRKKPRITMDLTEEGDGYRVIRPVQEMIVISDDESDEEI